MRPFPAALLALLLCLGLGGCAARTEPPVAETPVVTAAAALPAPPAPAEPAPYPLCRVYFDGLLSDRGFCLDGTAYLAPDVLCAFLGVDYGVQVDEAGFTASLPGLALEGAAGQEYMTAGSRYLYLPAGYLVWNGRLYLPSDAVGRILGLEITLSEGGARADLSPASARLMDGGADYYQRRFRSEDIYWLQHIIVSESYQQPLAGQIGVGNVVLNRLADPRYPDTVMEVVIDREGGVQFDPAASGGVTMEPDEQSVIAAYLCLEGYNTVGDCMYFLNPDKASSRWFEENLTQAVVIGNHAFYH